MKRDNDAARTRRHEGRRSPFDSFVEHIERWVSQAPFFVLCAAIVAAWLISAPWWPDLKSWQVAIHTLASIFTLLLVVVLENAGRRANEAAQEKLNVIGEALVELLESDDSRGPGVRDAAQRLRDAIGLEDRH